MILKILGTLLAAYLVLLVILWGAQERLVFPAPTRPLPDPTDAGFLSGERVTIQSVDGLSLGGWFLPAEDGTSLPTPGLLWFYGNMETVGDLRGVFKAFKPPGVGLLVLDYRGYGQNPGRPTEADLNSDALIAYDYLASRSDIDATNIAVYGRSIGSSVATYVASEKPVSAVLLDSPMTSAQDVADKYYWFVPSVLIRLSLDNRDRARRISVPLMVVHGEKDRIIPIWMGAEVAEAAPQGKFVVLKGVGHNATYGNIEAYREIMWDFLGANLLTRDSADDAR